MPTAFSVNPSDPSEVWAVSHEFPQGFPIRQELSTVLPGNVLARSTDGGATFSAVSFAPDASSRIINQVLFDPRDPGVVWAAGAGIFRYRNGTWESLPLPSGPTRYEPTISAIAIDAGSGTVYEATRIEVLATRDDGRTWTDITANLPCSGRWATALTALVADPLASGTLYLAASGVDTLTISPETYVEGGVFRTTDSGATQERLGEALGDAPVREAPSGPPRGSDALCGHGRRGVGSSALRSSQPRPRLARLGLDRGEARRLLLTGDGFGAGTRVTVGGSVPQSVDLLDARSLRIRTPAHEAGPADVVVTNPDGGLAALAGAFRYEEWGSRSEVGLTLCLEKGRFAVCVTRPGATAHAETFTTTSGWFWFDWSQIPDAAVKILDGRSENGRYWIAVSTLTDDPLTLTVTDTVTGRSREYHGAPGQPLAIMDRETFASD